MKSLPIILLILSLTGCMAVKEVTNLVEPQILLQQPLPPLPGSTILSPFTIKVAIYILEDGSVGKIIMRQGSGIAGWDSQAVAIFKNWRFLPARNESGPLAAWYNLQSRVRFESPVFMTLAEVQCTTFEEANSVYTQLESGRKLSEVITPCCVDTIPKAESGVETVNIFQYPAGVRDVLTSLGVGEHSKPIAYGDRFVIFQRLNYRH